MKNTQILSKSTSIVSRQEVNNANVNSTFKYLQGTLKYKQNIVRQVMLVLE